VKRRIHKVTRVSIEKPSLAVVIVETACGRIFNTMGEWTDIGSHYDKRVNCKTCRVRRFERARARTEALRAMKEDRP